MKHYVGLDVSLKEVSICVIDADGVVAAEGKVATEPALIVSWIEEHIGTVERIVHESGPLSIWLTRENSPALAHRWCASMRGRRTRCFLRGRTIRTAPMRRGWRNCLERAGTGKSTSRVNRATGCAFCSARVGG